jgi:hypothetical protein
MLRHPRWRLCLRNVRHGSADVKIARHRHGELFAPRAEPTAKEIPMEKAKTMTVRELRDILDREVFPYPEAEIFFGHGDLTFSRIKVQGYLADNQTPYLIQIQFNEFYSVTADRDGNS